MRQHFWGILSVHKMLGGGLRFREEESYGTWETRRDTETQIDGRMATRSSLAENHSRRWKIMTVFGKRHRTPSDTDLVVFVVGWDMISPVSRIETLRPIVRTLA
jgi:hypothetical protein